MEVLNITFIPAQKSIQAVFCFEYKNKKEHAVTLIDLSKNELTTDFTAIEKDPVFIANCEQAMSKLIDRIEKKEVE